MPAERVRATWTDERLDDLARRMDRGFDRIDQDLRSMNGRIDAMQRTMVTMMATILVGFAGLIGSQVWLIATQL